jgi:hypothetical protein
MAQGAEIKMVSLVSVMHTAPFNRGYKEALAGNPMNYNAYESENDQFAYERGPHFAALYNGAIKNNKKVRKDALYIMKEAVYNGYII